MPLSLAQMASKLDDNIQKNIEEGFTFSVLLEGTPDYNIVRQTILDTVTEYGRTVPELNYSVMKASDTVKVVAYIAISDEEHAKRFGIGKRTINPVRGLGF